MSGMDRITGRALDADAHLAQSIADILGTPLGTLVMRRDYGSTLPDLIDAPINGETFVDVVQASAEALAAWEPRITLERVQILAASPGRAELRLDVSRAAAPIALDITVDLDPLRAARAAAGGRS
ncbi:GPW/gp25 family protein [Profundibacterium mesophilum]|uniref:Bacteriophage baseplate assembly protein W n=1 Tax=Profundibacterium mesophilum KAUST100406-0324 TaxID=1037889 RepID=A0A921TDY6_9RHOB|nr:GPW/gp25 family protein [Profundibacterium mesophilum]KAF0676737.1 putative bacteriophage baseplate assembly protein W [Profundibacterium mesophilum KAUST100406-0324]